MSIFCVFSANIPFASNNGPFLEAKIRNYLDILRISEIKEYDKNNS